MFIDKLKDPIKNFFTKEEKMARNVVELPNISQPEAVEVEENLISWNYNYDIQTQNLKTLVIKYREVASNFEVALAVDEIVHSAVVFEDNIVDLNLDNTKFSDNIQEKIREEFDYIKRLLSFAQSGDDIFKKWYVDGRLYYQNVIDPDNPKLGILKMKLLSPLDLTRYTEKESGRVFYIWKLNEQEAMKRNAYAFTGLDEARQKIWRVPEQLITFVPSGLTDVQEFYYISYLHKAIKPFNQLDLIENSAIIYRLTRAPERRVFYIDVGRLPKKKAEAYVQKLINKFKNKISYDANSGELNQSKKTMTLLEDFYIPRNGDQKGTQIETLQSGTLIDKIDDILYFKKKLYKSLNVPTSRIDKDDSPVVNIGNTGEITREELKFDKFVNKLRNKFTLLFRDTLKKQLLLKGIINVNEWYENEQFLAFNWSTDSYFTELKDQEILKSRIEVADSMEKYIGKYFSHEKLRKDIFKQTDDDIKLEDKTIIEEKKTKKYIDMEDNQDNSGDNY